LLTLFYVTNWAAALQLVRSLGPLGITWSLAIEEQFYLLWPPLLAVMLRLGWTRRSILLVLTGLVLLVVGYRALLWGRGVNFGRLYYSSHTRADSLLLGCIAGLLVAWDLVGRGARMACWLKTLALVAVLLLVVLVNVIDSTAPFLYCGGFALVALAVAVLLLALTLAPPKLLLVPLRFAPLTWVGRISYALYLWHWPVHWYQYRLPGTRGRQALLGVALSFALLLSRRAAVPASETALHAAARASGQGSGAADRGQKIGTSSMMMTKTATVSMPPTLTKSKKR
jgi:peptidoglycan/LPS O-acetylase OafA/YrhL